MRGPERVVHVDVAEVGELLGKPGIVLLFLRMKAQVLEQQHFAGLGQHRFDRRADAIGGHGDWLTQELRQAFARKGFRLISGFGLPLGRPRWLARINAAPWSSAY